MIVILRILHELLPQLVLQVAAAAAAAVLVLLSLPLLQELGRQQARRRRFHRHPLLLTFGPLRQKFRVVHRQLDWLKEQQRRRRVIAEAVGGVAMVQALLVVVVAAIFVQIGIVGQDVMRGSSLAPGRVIWRRRRHPNKIVVVVVTAVVLLLLLVMMNSINNNITIIADEQLQSTRILLTNMAITVLVAQQASSCRCLQVAFARQVMKVMMVVVMH
jgi:hypothetical protein